MEKVLLQIREVIRDSVMKIRIGAGQKSRTCARPT